MIDTLREFRSAGFEGAESVLGGALVPGYYWGRALLVRPPAPVAGGPTHAAAWNALPLWRRYYPEVPLGVSFFAEDMFGYPFGTLGSKVVQLDLESGRVRELAEGVSRFCAMLREEPDVLAGASLCAEWEGAHHLLPVGHRLLPKKAFLFGGDFSMQNLVSRPDTAVVEVCGEIYAATKAIPDGGKVKFRVEE